MKQPHNIQNVIGLLQTEQILKRHLADTRRDIMRACADIAMRASPIHTSPDINLDGMGVAAAPSRIIPDVVIVVAIEGDAL